jgi:undecaprenyl-phosphate galactose phosphotransferase
LVALLLPLGRVVIKKMMLWTGAGLRPILIVGTGRNSLSAYRALRQEGFLGYRVIGFGVQGPENLPEGAHVKIAEATLPVHVLGDKPSEKLQELGRPNVAVALDSLAGSESFLWALGRASKSLILFPPIRGLPLLGMEVSQLFSQDLLMLRLRNNLGRRGMRAIKWVFDELAAAILLVLLSGFLVVIGFWLLRSGRPLIYGHQRIGQNGKLFRCYKFRTMIPDAERVLKDLLERSPEAAAEWAKDFKLRNDPRITPIGRFLRRTSLDELPQLWNVLKGEMSLVGPRPVVLEELARYGEYADYYLQSKPGITGVWQVSRRSDTTYEERVSMDAWYARNWSLWYDFVILLKTVAAVAQGRGAY